MALKVGQLFALLVVLFLQSCSVLSFYNDCGVEVKAIDINGANSPIVLKPQERRDRHILEIYYPSYLDSKCLVRNVYMGSELVRLACPQHYLTFSGLKNWKDNEVSTTSLIVDRGSNFENLTVITPEYPSAIPFAQMSEPIKCTGAVEPSMKKLSKEQYQVGYQMNALDFLPVYDLTFTDQFKFAHAKILPIISRRPKIKQDNQILRMGRVFGDADFTSSTKDHLAAKMKEELKQKFSSIAENNHLVHAQLLSKDDLFYIPEQRATFFLENTALAWKSINDGNWKLVGNIVRNLASETVTDLDVYSGSLECLTLGKIPIHLYNLKNSTMHTCVPKFLFKIALDERSNLERGIVFITVNDPSLQIDEDGSIPSDFKLCDKKPECDQLYPEFTSPKKGYTYCCDLKDFIPWKEIQRSSIPSETPTVMPFYGPFSRMQPVPSPPPLPRFVAID